MVFVASACSLLGLPCYILKTDSQVLLVCCPTQSLPRLKPAMTPDVSWICTYY